MFLSVKFNWKSSLFPELHLTFKGPGFPELLLGFHSTFFGFFCKQVPAIQVPLCGNHGNRDICEKIAEGKQRKVCNQAESTTGLLLPKDSLYQLI